MPCWPPRSSTTAPTRSPRSRPRSPRPGSRPGLFLRRPERVQRRVAGQEDRPAVRDHGVEGPAAHVEDLAAGARAEAGGVLLAEVREVHDVADDGRSAGDLAPVAVRP